MFEDEARKKPVSNFVLGQSLENLSVAELEKLLAALDAEKERVLQDMAAKKASAAAADAFFKPR